MRSDRGPVAIARMPRTRLDLDAPAIGSLRELAEAEDACTRCPLYKHATQAVPGEGRGARASDAGRRAARRQGGSRRQAVRRTGRPRARSGAGGSRHRARATSSSPTRSSISSTRCAASGACTSVRTPTRSSAARWWLDLERAIVKPAAIVALGATAARSLFGRVGHHHQAARQAHHSSTTAPPLSSPSTRRSCCASRTRPTRNANTAISSPTCAGSPKSWPTRRLDRA